MDRIRTLSFLSFFFCFLSLWRSLLLLLLLSRLLLSLLRTDRLSLPSDELGIERDRVLRLFLSIELSRERERVGLRLLLFSLDSDLRRGDFRSSLWRGTKELLLSMEGDLERRGECLEPET